MTAVGWVLVGAGVLLALLAAGAVEMRVARAAAQRRAELVDEYAPTDRRQP